MPPPRPELRGATRPAPPPRRSGTTGWVVTLLALLVIAGGGYYAYRTYFQKPPQVSVATSEGTPAASATPQKSVRDRVGEYLATKPTPEAMLAKAREFAKAGDLGAAFLVFRSAAETGNVPAELEIADYYDPLTQPAKGGFTPDGPRAADWYERAAIAGSAEAQRKLGLLLAKGGGGLSADQGKAKTWLQQAAAQNDAQAKKALEGLPK
jgi:TPR repeat protein